MPWFEENSPKTESPEEGSVTVMPDPKGWFGSNAPKAPAPKATGWFQANAPTAGKPAPVPGMEKLGGTPPGPAPAPRVQMEYNQFGRTPIKGSGPVDTGLEMPYRGMVQAVEGIQQIQQNQPKVRPVILIPGSTGPIAGQPSSKKLTPGREVFPPEQAEGLEKVIGGAMEASTPLLAPALVTAPIATVATLGAATAIQAGTQKALESQGVDPRYAGLAGTVASLLAISEGGRRIVRNVGRKAWEAAGSPEIKIGGKFEEPKPFRDMTDDELLAHANTIEQNPPKNYEWQKEQIVQEAARRQAERGMAGPKPGSQDVVPATPEPAPGLPPDFKPVAEEAPSAGITPVEVIKGATFTPEPGKSITVRSVTKSGKVAFTDASRGRTLPMAEFRALVGLPPVQAATPVAETTTPVVAPSAEAQVEPVAPVAQPTSATATPEAEAAVAPAEALIPVEEPNANLTPSDTLPAQAEPGSSALAPRVDAAQAEAAAAQAPAASAEAGAAVRVGSQVPPVSGASSTPEPAAVPPVADVAPVPPGVTDTGAVSPPAPASTSEVLSTFPGEENTEAVVAKVQDGYSVVVRDKDSGDFADSARIFKTQPEAEAYAKTIAPLAAKPADNISPTGKEPEDNRKISGKEPEGSTGKESLQVPDVAENATTPDPRLAQIEAHRAKAQELMAQARKLNGRDRKPLLDQAQKEVEEAGRLRGEMEGEPRPGDPFGGVTAVVLPVGAAGPKPGPEALIESVYQKLKSGGSLGNVTEFNKMAEAAFGSSRTSGEWTPKDAFDAMEAGINRYLIEEGKRLMEMPAEQALQELRGLMDRVTSQGVRTEEQIKNQQFSTPPTESYVVARVANLNPSDVVLEPSAGNGGIAMWPKSIGATVHVNEIADRRVRMLKAAGFESISSHDGEIINSLLDRSVQPTVVLMNPPFSAGTVKSGDSPNKNIYGFNHVDSALQRLAPGGRLVAILGGGRADDMNGGANLTTGPSGKWFERIARQHNVRANIRVHGKEYQKYGTSFATRIIVIDKTGPTPSMNRTGVKTWDSVIQKNVDTLEEAYNALRGIENDRPEAGSGSIQGAGQRQPAAGVAGTPGRAGAGAGEPAGGVRGAGAADEPAGRPGRPSGDTGANGPGGGNQPTPLRQPEPRPAEPSEADPAFDPPGSPLHGSGERPLAGDGGLAQASGLTPEQIIEQATKALAEKLGQTPKTSKSAPAASAPAAPVRRVTRSHTAGSAMRSAGLTPATPEPAKPSTNSALTAAADAARDALRAMMQGGPAALKAQVGPTAIPPQAMVHLATIGAEHIINGSPDYDQWALKVQADVGDVVRWVADQIGQTPEAVLRAVHGYAKTVAAQFDPTPLDGNETDDANLSLEKNDAPKSEEEDSVAYVNYRPMLKGPEHPGAIVETKTMATVPLPAITYKPNLPNSVIENKGLSAIQLEAIAIAGQQNSIVLPGGFRASALIGDGTGVGKGRIGAGIMWDNWRQGRRRIVFVTEKWDLAQDMLDAINGIGAKEMMRGVTRKKDGPWLIPPTASVKMFNAFKYGVPIKHSGILFSTYGTVRAKDKTGNRRVAQLQEYLAGDDGGEGALIVFDEAHTLKNAVVSQGGQPSQIGQAARQLLAAIPGLRSVSLSATAATDVMNLGYLDRLGIWGPGTPFPNGFNEFSSQISGGGLSAMELIARELKAQGKYVSRTLSFKGVEYATEEHQLVPEQKELYRTAARAWASVIQRAEASIAGTTNGGTEQRRNFNSQLGSAQQRFFGLLITALKTSTCVELANKALAENKSVVITLVNTNEAAQNREKARVAARDEDDDDIPDYDFGPKQLLIDLVRTHYPVQQYRDDVDSGGNPIKVPVYRRDENGREVPVNNPQAEAERDAMIAELDASLHMPENPLDILINSLGGPGKVAELTGRKERYDASVGKFVPRGGKGVSHKNVNIVEARNFQEGKKRIAILSSAAGTGISLHSGNDVPNRQRRYHITLQAGWSADKAMQMLGRTHRTNQAHPPEYVLLVSDLGGEKRFISTIARRLGSLGALTKGQKNASSGNDLMEKVNFETDQGRAATAAFYDALLRNGPIPGALSLIRNDDGSYGPETAQMTGLQVLLDLRVLTGTPPTVPQRDRQNVTKLLNRLLALDPDIQNSVYNYFYDIFQATVQRAIDDGTLDTGVKTLPGDEFSIKEARVISKDPKTGAETFYYPVESRVRSNRVSPQDLENRIREYERQNHHPRIVRNDKGKLALVVDAPPIVHANGRLEDASYVSTPERGEWKKVANHAIRATEIKEWVENKLPDTEYEVTRLQGRVEMYQGYAKQYPGDAYYEREAAESAEKLARAQKDLAELQAAANDPDGWAREQWAEQYGTAPSHIVQEHHLIGGAVMRFWNPIRDSAGFGNNIFTTSDSNTGQRIVGVDIPAERINRLLASITGGRSTVNADQLYNDVLRNNMTYALENNIQVRRGRVAGSQVVQLIPPSKFVGDALVRMGVKHELGITPVYYIGNSYEGSNAWDQVIGRVLSQYPAQGEDATPATFQSRADSQGLWIFRNGTSQPINRFLSHEAYARTAGKSEAQLMKDGAIRVRGGNVEAWLPRDLNTPAGRKAMELASQFDPYGNVTVSYRGPSEKASFAVYNKPDLEDSGFDVKRTREGIAGAAALQGRKDKPFILGTFVDEGVPETQKGTGAWERFFAGLEVGSEPGAAKATLDVSSLARLNDAPIPENAYPTLAEAQAYWDGAAVQATTLENVPTLLVNNAGMDAIIQAKTLPNQRPTESSEGSVGLALRPDEWGRVLAASRLAGESLRPGGYDAALVKIGKALKGAIPQGHELGVLILQTGERFPESTVATVAQEELDHALQLKMKGGLAAQPVHLLDTDPIIQKAQEGLILRAGYKRPNPKSPWYDNDRAVMMAEIGVRLMRGNRYQEMNLTPQEASDAMVTYAMALAQVGGEAANDIVEVLYATRKTLDSERRTNQQAQHAPDREGSEAGRNRGGPEGGGLGLSGDSSARAGTGEAPGAAAVLHEAGAERGAGTGIADRSSADLESRAGELGLTISDEPPAGAVALEARTAPTWESLARDVRSLSDEDLKRVWKRRFLRPLREFPGAETVTLEIAGEEDWDALRDTLESFLQEAEAKGMPPAPPSRKEPPKEPPAGGGDGPARAQEGAVYAPRPTAYRGLIDFLKPVSTRIAEQGKAGAVLSKYLTKTQDEGELDAAKRIVRLIDAGLMDLSRDDRANLMDVLEGRADPLDDRVKTAFDAVRKITDEIAASAISSRVIVRVNRKIGPEDEVPEGVTLSPTQEEKLGRGEHIKVSYERGFQALDNYYPHVIPSTDTLKHGQIRNDVVKNLVAQGVAPSEASAAGMIDGYRAFVDSGKRAAELEQYLVDSGQAEDADAAFAMLRRFRSRHIHRQGSLEYSREVDLPFYDPDPARVLPPFVHATSVRLAQIRVFGQKNQRITQLIRLIEQNGGDADFVRGAVDRILSMVDEPDRSAARLSRALRVIQGFKLGLSSIPNVTQGALNTLLKSKDLAAVLSGAQGVLTKKGRRLGLESGAALEGVIDEMVRYTAGEGHLLTTFLKAVGFTATERANRVFAANAGATWASRLLRRLQHDPNDSFARDQLTDLGLNPDALLKQGKLLPDDVLMAAKRMSDLTQFRSDVKDLPYFASSPWGKVIFQFKNYIYGETRLIHDAVVSEFRAGRLGSGFKALLVLMIAFPLAGEAIADIRTLIKGGKIEDRPKGLKRYFDDIAQAGTLGMVQDFAQSASYGRSAEWIAGPTVGEVAETAENIARGVAAGTREKDPTWNFRALGRQAFRRVPIIGTRLANWVFPAKPKASTRGIGSFVGARAGRF